MILFGVIFILIKSLSVWKENNQNPLTKIYDWILRFSFSFIKTLLKFLLNLSYIFNRNAVTILKCQQKCCRIIKRYVHRSMYSGAIFQNAWSRSIPGPLLSSILTESLLTSIPFHCLNFQTILLESRCNQFYFIVF